MSEPQIVTPGGLQQQAQEVQRSRQRRRAFERLAAKPRMVLPFEQMMLNSRLRATPRPMGTTTYRQPPILRQIREGAEEERERIIALVERVEPNASAQTKRQWHEALKGRGWL